MASSLKPFPGGRLLRELLEEQQEPFLLDIHLLENGHCGGKLIKSHTTFMCWPKSLCCRRRRRRRRGGILRCLLAKLGDWEAIRKALNWDDRDSANARPSLCCCFSEMGNSARVAGFRRISFSDVDESKQLSPVSVLELHSEEGSSVHNHLEEENPCFSCLDSVTEPHFSTSPRYGEEKKELHTQRQLSFDPVKEMEESIWSSRECFNGEVDHIAQLIDLDILRSQREWSHCHGERRAIGMEIEGVIFEEIREESVLDMLGFHCTLQRC